MDALARALAWLDGQQAQIESLLAELVEISSHTPDLDGTSRVAARYAEAALALGGGALTGGVHASASGRYGAHMSLATSAAGAPVLLIGHHDTVFPSSLFA